MAERYVITLGRECGAGCDLYRAASVQRTWHSLL